MYIYISIIHITPDLQIVTLLKWILRKKEKNNNKKKKDSITDAFSVRTSRSRV